MPYNPRFHHRHSLRLQNYDYAQAGAYFVTLTTHERTILFGEIENGEMYLNPLGKIAQEQWQRLAKRFPGIELEAFGLMPDHIHGIIIIVENDDKKDSTPSPTERFSAPVAGSLASIVRAYKSSVTQRYQLMSSNNPSPLWQRNYYEHVIRSEAELERIRAYIAANPSRW